MGFDVSPHDFQYHRDQGFHDVAPVLKLFSPHARGKRCAAVKNLIAQRVQSCQDFFKDTEDMLLLRVLVADARMGFDDTLIPFCELLFPRLYACTCSDILRLCSP